MPEKIDSLRKTWERLDEAHAVGEEGDPDDDAKE